MYTSQRPVSTRKSYFLFLCFITELHNYRPTDESAIPQPTQISSDLGELLIFLFYISYLKLIYDFYIPRIFEIPSVLVVFVVPQFVSRGGVLIFIYNHYSAFLRVCNEALRLVRYVFYLSHISLSK